MPKITKQSFFIYVEKSLRQPDTEGMKAHTLQKFTGGLGSWEKKNRWINNVIHDTLNGNNRGVMHTQQHPSLLS